MSPQTAPMTANAIPAEDTIRVPAELVGLEATVVVLAEPDPVTPPCGANVGASLTATAEAADW
jgi:hypothetical protein